MRCTKCQSDVLDVVHTRGLCGECFSVRRRQVWSQRLQKIESSRAFAGLLLAVSIAPVFGLYFWLFFKIAKHYLAH